MGSELLIERKVKECLCGCGKLIPEKDKRGRTVKFHSDCFSVGKPLSEGVKRYLSERIKANPERLQTYIDRINKVNNEVKEGKRQPGGYVDGYVRAREDGYLMVRCWGHPRAHKNGYVFEHILVMEQHIGRYLPPAAVVHHINRDRQDNRIENLLILPSGGEHQKLHSAEDNRRDRFGRFVSMDAPVVSHAGRQ